MYLIILLILFLILLLFYYNKINIKENYGIYCGKYNTNKNIAKKLCINDKNCLWKELLDQQGKKSGWCTQV